MFLFRSFLFRCFYLNVLFLCFYLFCLDLVLIIFCLNRNEQLLVIVVYLFVCKITKSCFRSTRIGMDCNQRRSFETSSRSIFFTCNKQSTYISTWFNKGNGVVRKLGKIPTCSTLLTI